MSSTTSIRSIKIRENHLTTLGDNTPKSRRRVRALLNLDKGEVVTASHVMQARTKARLNGIAKKIVEKS